MSLSYYQKLKNLKVAFSVIKIFKISSSSDSVLLMGKQAFDQKFRTTERGTLKRYFCTCYSEMCAGNKTHGNCRNEL